MAPGLGIQLTVEHLPEARESESYQIRLKTHALQLDHSVTIGGAWSIGFEGYVAVSVSVNFLVLTLCRRLSLFVGSIYKSIKKSWGH